MKVPSWFYPALLSGLSLLIVSGILIGVLYSSSASQIDDMVNKLSAEVQDNIDSKITDIIDELQLEAIAVRFNEPLVLSGNMPNSSYDPIILLRLMNTFYNLNVESMGIIMKGPLGYLNGNSKISWELARNFGCPYYIYAFADESTYPNFDGYCAFENGTISTQSAYNGTDWGLKPEEAMLLDGQLNETFLPIFSLLGTFTLTYESIYYYDNVPYVLTFAEKSLAQLDQFMSQLTVGKSGLAYVIERKPGYLITSTIQNQTQNITFENGQMVISRVAAVQAQDDMIRRAANFLGNLSNFIGENQWTNNGLSITATQYGKINGLDWVIITVIPRDDFIGGIRGKSIGAAIGASITVLVIIVLTIAIMFILISKPLKKLASELESGSPLLADSPISEINSLQDKLNNRFRT
jgi:hypothetical protein